MGTKGKQKSEHMGTCQVCFRLQKAPKDRLSLHGYTRPGDGFLNGECIGSRELPYELSCETTKRVLANLETHLSQLKEYFTKLKNRKVPEFVWEYMAKTEHGKEITKHITVHIGDARKPAPADRSMIYMYTYPHIPSYDEMLEKAIYQQERKISLTEYDIIAFKDKVKRWELKPLKPIPENRKKFVIQYKNLVSEYVFDPKYAWDKTHFGAVGVWQKYKVVDEDKIDRAKEILERKKKKNIKAGIIEIRVIPFTDTK